MPDSLADFCGHENATNRMTGSTAFSFIFIGYLLVQNKLSDFKNQTLILALDKSKLLRILNDYREKSS